MKRRRIRKERKKEKRINLHKSFVSYNIIDNLTQRVEIVSIFEFEKKERYVGTVLKKLFC